MRNDRIGRVRLGAYMVAEKCLRWALHPRLRAHLLRALGARIGSNVRVHEVVLFNLARGFRNLELGDDVFVGPGCLLDLEGPLRIGTGTTVAPGVTILTHTDVGSSHAHPLAALYPATRTGVVVASHCFVGARSTLLDGASIGERSVVAAGSVVRGTLAANSLHAGVPARFVRRLGGDAAPPGGTPDR